MCKVRCPTEGAEIYVTHFPCLHCCKSLIQAGIKRVYYAEDYKNHAYAIELFEQAGVVVEQVELEEMILDLNSEEKLKFTAELLKQLEGLGLNDEQLQELKLKANQLYTSL